MKHWHESAQVFRWLAQLAADRQPAALATVIDVQGSAYRREGARMAVSTDRSTRGNVSGGCLEQDVREVALQVIRSGVPETRTYCSGHGESAWDLGLGCDGRVTVYVEPAGSGAREVQRLAGRVPFALCTPIRSGVGTDSPQHLIVTSDTHELCGAEAAHDSRLVDAVRARLQSNATAASIEWEGRPLFIDIYCPPPRLLIFGAGDDACPVVRLACDVGFDVDVIDHRPAMLRRDRFADGALLRCVRRGAVADADACGPPLGPDDFVVIMTHDYEQDLSCLRAMTATLAGYIGLLGPHQRCERLIAAIGTIEPARMFGPVGLDIGAEGAEQVAVAIVAELLAVRQRREAHSLRDRVTAIHAG